MVALVVLVIIVLKTTFETNARYDDLTSTSSILSHSDLLRSIVPSRLRRKSGRGRSRDSGRSIDGCVLEGGAIWPVALHRRPMVDYVRRMSRSSIV